MLDKEEIKRRVRGVLKALEEGRDDDDSLLEHQRNIIWVSGFRSLDEQGKKLAEEIVAELALENKELAEEDSDFISPGPIPELMAMKLVGGVPEMSDCEKVLCYESHIEKMLAAIQERMDELNNGTELSEFDQGRQMAFLEVMDIIKTRHSIILEVIAE